MSAHSEISGMFSQQNLGKTVADEILHEHRAEISRALRRKEQEFPEKGKDEYGPGLLLAALILEEWGEES